MAWVESHQALRDHPKVFDLMALMGWDLDTTIGKLHRFWWWCVDYAEDGDLRKHNESRLGAAVGITDPDEAKRFVRAMVDSKWIDDEPFMRVHDWWDYIGLFLQRKYGSKKKDRWESIQGMYYGTKNTAKEGSPGGTALPKRDVAAGATDDGGILDAIRQRKKEGTRIPSSEELQRLKDIVGGESRVEGAK
jgi:hypothetical protein